MKEVVYQFCQGYIESRIQRIRHQIIEIQLALKSESRSTAGDKHETGRAMLHLEREKLGQQLLEAERTQQIFKKVPVSTKTDKVSLGSLVVTDKASYYIAISAGLYHQKGQDVYCISSYAPIAKQLFGKKVNDTIKFNNITSKIIAIS